MSSLRLHFIALICSFLQIRSHCNAFRRGMSDVINLEWLRMFDHHELQVLVSGASVPVDIEDLRQHTNYSGKTAPKTTFKALSTSYCCVIVILALPCSNPD